MIPSKSKALLAACGCESRDSMLLNWAGLGLTVLFLAFAITSGL